MQFQSAFVRLGDGEGERIIERRRRAALNAGKIFRPRLQAGGVKRVAGRAHLKDDGVQFQCRRAIEDGDEFGLLLRGGKAGLGRPAGIADGGNPGGPEFAGGWRRNYFPGGKVVIRSEKNCGQQQNGGEDGTDSIHDIGQ